MNVVNRVMNFSLNRIESNVSEDLLLQAEEILENAPGVLPQEVDKNLWIIVLDNQEIEVQLSGNKVIGGSCECNDFSEKGTCAHIVSAMMAVRKAKPPRKTKPRKINNSQRLTTSLVLDSIEKEELVAFIREYARTHRNFAIALKARFASSISLANQKDKYQQLLESTISSARKPDRSITIRGAQKLLKVLQELDIQLVQSISEGDYLEAYYMARAIIENVSPLLNKLKGKKEEILALIQKTFNHLEQLATSNAAPSLLNDLWHYLLTEGQRLPYRPNGIDLYFFRVLQLMVQEDVQQESLLAAIEQQIQKYQQENRTITPLILAKLTALEQAGKQKEAQQLTTAYLNEPDVLQYAIAQAQKKGLRPRVKALAETGLKLHFPREENAKLENLLLQMAEEDQDKALIYHYAISRFKDSLDFSYYFKAKQHTTASWEEQVEALLQWLSSRSYSLQNQEAIANIYRQENQLEALMELLERTSSILLLMQFSHALMPDYQERLFLLYKRLVDQYTNQHIGRKAARRVSEVITHLFKDGTPELAYEIISKLRNTYPERHTLMEALTEFE